MAELIDRLDDSRESHREHKAESPGAWALEGPAFIQEFFEGRGIDRSKRRGWTPKEMDEQIVQALIEDEERIRREANADTAIQSNAALLNEAKGA